MKKFTLLFLVMSLLVVSFGCNKVEEQPKDPVVETPVEEPKEPTDAPEVVIKPVDKVDVENLTVLDEYSFDFDNDGEEETIAMYTVAQRDSKGEIIWDDGQNWLFVVHDTDKDYVLIDEYVQLGSIDFNIFIIEEEFYIAAYSARTASLSLKLFQYDSENDTFKLTVPYNTDGNVNMLKSSYGY